MEFVLTEPLANPQQRARIFRGGGEIRWCRRPPELRNDVGTLTPKLEKVIHTLEWVRIKEFVTSSWCGEGRPPHERSWLANAFVAKSVLGMTTTQGLIERLTIDRALRRICGFLPCRKLPSESTFSRAFDEFAEAHLAKRVHEALIKDHLGDELIGHISRDGTASKARERPVRSKPLVVKPAPSPVKKRGRPVVAMFAHRSRNRPFIANASRPWRRCSRISPRRGKPGTDHDFPRPATPQPIKVGPGGTAIQPSCSAVIRLESRPDHHPPHHHRPHDLATPPRPRVLPSLRR